MSSKRRDELYHYGVLGMKWGVHKARKYSRDVNRYVRDKKQNEAVEKYSEGKMSEVAFRRAVKRYHNEMLKKNQEFVARTANISPKKGAKISSIYKEHRDQAIKTIPHYRAKQGAKIAGNILLNVGETALFSMLGPGGLAGVGAATFAKNAATSIAIDAALSPVVGLAVDELENRPYKKRR